ncbi:nucleotidyltransferase domain-containing protein [Candidatus Pacearchaeota archaeon]|nr:nucleotidyltransferase domain-containing protein [Candidatus Pacearchaeota archaeon]
MNMLNFLKQNKNTRKIFGERELKIIEKQLNGITLTQSEKNRLSRDIRKKFEFIKDAERFSDEFELKKGQKIKQMIDDAVKVILRSKYSKDIKRIILFGSTVTNDRTFRSDIDIAVEFINITEREAVEFRIRAMGELSDMMDIQVYNVLPEKIRNSIDKNGRILYERN